MILSILRDTHPKLRMVAKDADPKLAHHRTLARRLVETLKAADGLGIASNQVHPGECVRIIAIKTKEYSGAMFNPEVIQKSTETSPLKEGCLSSRHKVNVTRSAKIKVRFQTMTEEVKELEFEGLSAHVVLHEIDHLFGVLIADYL